MININNKINFFLILLNIFFLIYYSAQLLIYTDEFAEKNIGFFNHAIAGLSEIIGIIFLCLALGLIAVIFQGTKNQFPLLFTILIIHIILSLNFWRYVVMDAPGETDINSIIYNAFFFSVMGLSMIILIVRLKKSLFNLM